MGIFSLKKIESVNPLEPLARALGSVLGPKSPEPVRWAGLFTVLYFVNPFGIFPQAQKGGFLDSMKDAFGHMSGLLHLGFLKRDE